MKISDDAIRLLEKCKKHWDLLDADARKDVINVADRIDRGYRTNSYVKAALPSLHKKQEEFLALTNLEAMYGGAAGGGKSVALIGSALQYADVPSYSAIMFRRTFTDLSGEGSLMDRAQKFIRGVEGARWEGSSKSFFFETFWTYELFSNWKESIGEPVPEPWEISYQDMLAELGNPTESRIAFGYLDSSNDKYRYQGWEFQSVFFDELTQHPYENYSYLFSRLRRLERYPIPIRMRSATNPGGQHGDWVKERFIPREFHNHIGEDRFERVWNNQEECGECYGTGGSGNCLYCNGTGIELRVFVPALVADNPSVDKEEYKRSLVRLNPLERERLEHGRWDVVGEGNIFKESWFRYYHKAGEHFRYYDESGQISIVSIDRVLRFLTADTATKVKTSNDYTVVASWAMELLTGRLFLLNAIRDRFEVPDIAPLVYRESMQWQCDFVIIEDASSGTGVLQQLKRGMGSPDGFRRVTVLPFSPHDRDKVSRATVAAIKMEQGDVFFPDGQPPWLSPYVSELVSFGSEESGHDDCVDTLSMAAWFADHHEHSYSPNHVSRPSVIGGWRS